MENAARGLWLAGLLAALALSCQGGHRFSRADLDRARQALETCLDSWKSGQRPEKLRTLPEPVEFAEEWPQAGLRLLDYEILGTEHTDAEMMRFSVRLTVQDRRGRREERRSTYAVALKSPIAVGRDPFY
jgi:hypothetical protein